MQRADRVFVHGFTQTPASWESVVAAEPPRDVHDVDVFSRVPDGLSFVDVAHALGVFDATYIGYSMGGRLCLQLALDRPEVVRRLVLVSASPGIADPAERAARRDTDEARAQEIERDGVDAFLERWLAQPMFATLARDQAGLEKRRRDNTVHRLTSQLRVLGQGTQPSNWDRLGGLAMPVLLIVGELDPKYVEIARQMVAAIPDARIEVIAGTGHACHLERPEAVAHALSSW